MKYKKIREEELKNRVGDDWFNHFDTKAILGNVDFTVFSKQDNLFEKTPLLWAEAKTGDFDIPTMFVQLILTIGKARTFDKTLPPAFLGAFDFKKIAFVPYLSVQDIFYMNDFNWNVTPSNHETKEFKLIKERIEKTLQQNASVYDYEKDEKDLITFIKNNIAKATTISKIKIDKNNFIIIYNKWVELVKPTIAVNWDLVKKAGIIDGDFYLADLISEKNESLKENLYVTLKKNEYELNRKIDKIGLFSSNKTDFNDDQKAHTQFWNKYERPPKEEYWDYIIKRRDLLIPQDIRERKGSFFTPRKWVELSQKYLTDYLGENWQDEYYIWDCAAGTGNLLTGLNNRYNIYASTIDKQDVDVMRDRIENGANLLDSHVFQFDFLNDDFTKLPQSLQDIINDEEKRKKLVVYMNPPYAEHGNISTKIAKGSAKTGVAKTTQIYNDFSETIGTGVRELFTQFFMRIYRDIPNSILASFSTLKYINSQNFLKFRKHFKGEFEKGFVVPANTFDNVKGKFPIGFLIWNLDKKKDIKSVKTDVFDNNGNFLTYKNFYSFGKKDFISSWLRIFYDKIEQSLIGYLILPGVDMQSQNGVYITTQPTESDIKQHKNTIVTKNNLIPMCIYLTVRQIIDATWLNDRDQFLYPNDGWKTDTEFQNDCLAYTLFHGQNKISTIKGTNHWIPFTEQEVDAKEKFASNFMTQFIQGKLEPVEETELFVTYKNKNIPLVFSDEAKSVFDAGRELWKYYHSQKDVNVNASFYDIREYFQGRSEKGRMNSSSTDETYMELIKSLRNNLKILGEKIAPKVYEYQFLKE